MLAAPIRKIQTNSTMITPGSNQTTRISPRVIAILEAVGPNTLIICKAARIWPRMCRAEGTTPRSIRGRVIVFSSKLKVRFRTSMLTSTRRCRAGRCSQRMRDSSMAMSLFRGTTRGFWRSRRGMNLSATKRYRRLWAAALPSWFRSTRPSYSSRSTTPRSRVPSSLYPW